MNQNITKVFGEIVLRINKILKILYTTTTTHPPFGLNWIQFDQFVEKIHNITFHDI